MFWWVGIPKGNCLGSLMPPWQGEWVSGPALKSRSSEKQQYPFCLLGDRYTLNTSFPVHMGLVVSSIQFKLCWFFHLFVIYCHRKSIIVNVWLQTQLPRKWPPKKFSLHSRCWLYFSWCWITPTILRQIRASACSRLWWYWYVYS